MCDLDQSEQERKAEMAWQANLAMLKAQVADNSLFDNPYWVAAREFSYGRFLQEFEKLP